MCVALTRVVFASLGLFTAVQGLASELDAVFEKVTSFAPVCYSQTYSEEYLEQNPKQNITRIAVKLSYDTYRGRGDAFSRSPKVVISAQLRNGRTVRAGLGHFYHETSTVCSPECYEGAVKLSLDDNGNLVVDNRVPGAVHFDIPWIPVAGEARPESFRSDNSEGADDVFVLTPTEPYLCM